MLQNQTDHPSVMIWRGIDQVEMTEKSVILMPYPRENECDGRWEQQWLTENVTKLVQNLKTRNGRVRTEKDQEQKEILNKLYKGERIGCKTVSSEHTRYFSYQQVLIKHSSIQKITTCWVKKGTLCKCIKPCEAER